MGKSDNRVKAPVTNGVAKVPVVMQLEALECGAASLTMILAYYGKWIPLEQVRSDCGVSRDGSNAKNILRAARSYGLVAQGYRYETKELRKNGKFPCIVHWNFNHFVVLNGFKGNKAVLNDPSRGTYSISIENFDKSFTGICLMFEPSEAFKPEGKPKSMISFSKEKMRGAGVAVVFTIVTTVTMSLIGIINPAFSRIFVDRLLTGQNPDWFIPFIVSLAALSIIQIAMAFIEAIYTARIGAKIDALGSTAFMWKVLRLPMEFFSQRMAGDIQQRKGSNASVAKTLADTFAPLVIEAGMMVFYLVVMIRYSLLLTLVGVLSIVINLFLARIISQKRVNITRVSMRDMGKLTGATVAGI
ncbi:MAG: NHLP family bacteriocin export ABC transporter peptidase/permease/ATPase, partial [Clostridia bacterium]|nr:NHLP family bacteriocin export ABC transporter peptidase/permease/ATPase [Clostridia bacterium]